MGRRSKAKTTLRKVLHSLAESYSLLSPVKRVIAWSFILVILLAAVPTSLDIPDKLDFSRRQASYYFVSKYDHSTVGQMLDIELRFKTGTEPINVTGAYLQFNPAMLEVVKMTTDQSYCTFYTDNSFDNIKGTVDIACGTPNPGFQGDSTMVNLKFRAKNAGEAKIVMAKDSSILANDGHGTNLIKDFPIHKFTINAL